MSLAHTARPSTPRPALLPPGGVRPRVGFAAAAKSLDKDQGARQSGRLVPRSRRVRYPRFTFAISRCQRAHALSDSKRTRENETACDPDSEGRNTRDCPLDFNTVKLLKDRYGNTVTSTFWRMVEDRDPTAAVFGMVSQHPHYPDIGEGRNGQPWRDFPRSSAFRKQFARVTPQQAFALIGKHASYKKRGPVIAGTDVVADDSGVPHEVRLEGFCNTYSVMTIGTVIRSRAVVIAASG